MHPLQLRARRPGSRTVPPETTLSALRFALHRDMQRGSGPRARAQIFDDYFDLDDGSLATATEWEQYYNLSELFAPPAPVAPLPNHVADAERAGAIDASLLCHESLNGLDVPTPPPGGIGLEEMAKKAHLDLLAQSRPTHDDEAPKPTRDDEAPA